MKNKIKEELAKLQKLSEQWVADIEGDDFDILVLRGNIEKFRENTHVDFPNTNAFYMDEHFIGDIHFEDAQDNIDNYLENGTKENLTYAKEDILKGFMFTIQALRDVFDNC